MTISDTHYVDIHFWLPKDEIPTTLVTEQQHLKTTLGHVSMLMCSKDQVYVSLRRGEEEIVDVFQTLDQDQKLEGALPDTIIRLHRLDISKMIESFNAVAQRKILWAPHESAPSFISKLLKTGGLTFNESTEPKNRSFYYLTNCHLTKEPDPIGEFLLKTAAIAESNELGFQQTIEIMQSNRVAKGFFAQFLLERGLPDSRLT